MARVSSTANVREDGLMPPAIAAVLVLIVCALIAFARFTDFWEQPAPPPGDSSSQQHVPAQTIPYHKQVAACATITESAQGPCGTR